MRSLFLKIFLYFLLIILLVTGIAVFLTFLRDQEFPPLAHQSFARRAIAEYGREAIAVYEQAGTAQLDRFTRELLNDSGIRLLLFDDQLRPLTGRHTPRHMQHMAMRARRSGEVVLPMMMGGVRNGLASVVRSDSGRPYVVALTLPERPPAGQLVKGLTHGFLGLQLLSLLLVSALVCYLLARSLTRPITRLREATRRFAGGDLGFRIAGRVSGRNELAALAADFDDMAGKIENLVGAQKQLLRDISHELRSPLARLEIALEMARQQNQSDAGERALERIGRESARMNEMIGQLLSLTRLENGTGRSGFAPFDLAELLAELVQDAAYEGEQRACRVQLEGPQSLRYTGSRELLGRALENVIRNAVKYTAEQTAVRIVLEERPGQVRIRVRDQGPGVPGDSLDKLFEPFYRVADARDRQSGGSGIGLAIADRAVRLHQGTIRAENHPEGGLQVEIRLPQDI